MTEKEQQILREDYEERAAIKEFLGNMPREQAEREARQEQIYAAQKNAIKAAKRKTEDSQGQLALGPNPRRP